MLKHKIRFARACVRVDITEPLLEYAEITRASGVKCGYLLWYEDFSIGYSFCGCDDHIIDDCLILSPPQKEIKVMLMKHPKKK